ncbi:insulin-like [Limulus polyphemus]|uniref:Insulin-like n=1 Tax=Limulus polyphemus TaxID=6850 RepID=A0ABM1SZ58_LIMPO|nr:insulin-like [Limulus polyphemus]XP_022248915.1 insulin-like [Limulus polyphemus]
MATPVMIYACVSIGLLLATNGVVSVRLCGNNLSESLTFLCSVHGGFYSPQTKRSAPMLLLERIRRSVIIVNKRNIVVSRRSGVAEECCRRSCTLETLTSYCAFPRATEVSAALRRLNSLSRRINGYHDIVQLSQNMTSQNNVSEEAASRNSMTSENRALKKPAETTHRGSSGLFVNPRTEQYILE